MFMMLNEFENNNLCLNVNSEPDQKKAEAMLSTH